jgi:uncharacterized membrane protein
MQGTTAAVGRRFIFIDLFRSAVILLMLEGHLLRALLLPSLQGSALFRLHEFIHGLSAPAFLFGAGLTFVISTRRRWREYHHWGPPLSRRVRRLLLVYSLGVGLHLPFLSLRKIMIDGMRSDILQLFQCDVLHCIGIGLLVLHGLVFFFKTEIRFYGMVLSAVIAICFLTPLMWDINGLESLSPWLSQMVNGTHGSPFPLFPYLGFLFSGVLVSWEYLVAVERKREGDFMIKVFMVGSVLVFCGMLFDFIPFSIYPTYNYWFTSPNYFLIRAGALMILFSLFWTLTHRWKIAVPVLTVLGVESLLIYVAHLIVLYGTVLNPDLNLQNIIGATLPVGPVFLILLLFILSMLALALIWNYLKRRHPDAYRLFQLGVAAVFLLFFFLRDF